MKAKRTTILMISVVILLSGQTIFADDLFPPDDFFDYWQRGSVGTTFQQWSFPTSDPEPMSPDAGYYNPHGDPLLRVDSDYDWIASTAGTPNCGRDGIWALSGEIDMLIPNFPQQREEKQIWIQLTWRPGENDAFLPDEPLVGVVCNPVFDLMDMTRDDLDLGDGWTHSIFSIYIWPNPNSEWIAVKGDIEVDQIVVDTICIPEPATVLLLFAGGVAALRKKRFSVNKQLIMERSMSS